MKTTCQRQALLEAAQVAGAAVSSRDVKPILRNFKMAAGPHGCTLLATDQELSIRLEVRSVKVEQAGEALLPARRLADILREATDEELIVEAHPDKALVRGQANEFEMPSADPAEFPPVPEFTDETYHELQAGALREMIRRTAFAVAAVVTSHHGVPGVLWDISDGKCRLVGTDGRRLATATAPATSHGAADTKNQTHIVPTKAMGLLEKLLQDAGETVRLALRPNEALVKTERATVSARLVEARFPPYRELLGKKLPVKMPLDTGRFYSAVRQANIMAGEDSRRVELVFRKKKLTLQAQGSATGRARVELPIEYGGEELKINFDASYLIDMLRILPADAPLTLEMADANSPALFRSGTDYVYLVMPLT